MFQQDAVYVITRYNDNKSFDLEYYTENDTEKLEAYYESLIENNSIKSYNYWYGFDIDNLTLDENPEGGLFPSQGGISEYVFVLKYTDKGETLEKLHLNITEDIDSDDFNERVEKLIEESMKNEVYTGFEYWTGDNINELYIGDDFEYESFEYEKSFDNDDE